MKKLTLLFLLASLVFDSSAAEKKKIVMVAGTPSHGPLAHEFNAGTLLLKKCLDQVPGVNAVVYTNGWPSDPNAFDGAAAIFLFMDGGGGHPILRDNRLQKIGALMREGVGLGCAHYAVEVPKERGGPEFLEWIGGYYENAFSVNPMWTPNFQSFPDHPITRGVQPFSINDEWYFNMRFRPEMKGVTPILVAKPSDKVRQGPYVHPRGPYDHIVAASGRDEVMMWAVERADGGRGFGFTGGHHHLNWGNENFRKVVLNALLWIAKVEVPSGGVPSSVTEEDLMQNLDPKPGQKPPVRPTPAVSPGNPKWKSGIVRSGTVNVDVDISGATGLWLVVTDGGDGFGCDWADWAEPRLVRADGSEAKLTEMKWKSASTGWGRVNIDKNANGGPLRIGGKPIPYGIGTHANSVIEYDIAGKGFTRFKATAGLDNGGTDQGCGSTVEFLVFTEKPAEAILKAATSGGSGNASTQRGSGVEAAREALKTMTVHQGLEVSLFGSEPAILNPANMAIDARGRVWITEGANYRNWKETRPEGDRIRILEDTTGDGFADSVKTFYQGNDINTALGIAVLGDKIIVSCSPNVFVFTDADGDDKPDGPPQVLFTGIQGVQHDHGVHAFVFGMDGKLYFNFGDAGGQLRTPDGKIVTDLAGNEVSGRGRPYRKGMVFRCNLDGSEVEVLGHNFRNNYEVAVDSFGTLWQSDNDDDGNRAVRINYVMEFGNFGYTDELTGAGWRTKRTNMEKEIPDQHWYQNDPGVVPNLLITGAGSPCGIILYEGRLLPKIFHNQMIHCEPGARVVRAYPVTKNGAGYTAEIVNVLSSTDSWFRPSDVCVAPDGSIYVADWNDPGVGGHNMGDRDLQTMRGRVFRVAPQGHKAAVPKFDFQTAAGAVNALQNPNMDAQFRAWQALHKMQNAAEAELLKLWGSADPYMRARALHLLARIAGNEDKYIRAALNDANEDIRITGLRIARSLKRDVIPYVKLLVNDASPQVRRECAIALRHNASSEAPKLWAALARQHDGKDRWYLEALGIGADRQEDKFFEAWLGEVGAQWDTPAGRDIVWRSRASKAPGLLVKIILDEKTSDTERPRYLRALDFIRGPEKDAALIELLTLSVPGN
jgi:putative membrane-bound dehydrogenase-like protein